MIELGTTAVAAIALICGAWVAVAAWATLNGARKAREARLRQVSAERSEALLEASPAMSLLIDAGGSLGGSSRLASPS